VTKNVGIAGVGMDVEIQPDTRACFLTCTHHRSQTCRYS